MDLQTIQFSKNLTLDTAEFDLSQGTNQYRNPIMVKLRLQQRMQKEFAIEIYNINGKLVPPLPRYSK
jgi:hypothetical protein